MAQANSSFPTLLRDTISFLTILAGLVCLALLPIGFFTPLSGELFRSTFLVHLGLFSGAVVLSLLFFFQVVRRTEWPSIAAWGLLALILVVLVVPAFVPITARDALIHHLVIPKWWLEADSIARFPWHSWSHYPMLLQLGFTGFLQLGYEPGTVLYHMGHLVILAAVVAGCVQKRTDDNELSLVSFFLILLLPICLRLAFTPLVDLGLALYAAVAFGFALDWAENEKARFRSVLCGVALGLAMGCKYNGFLFTGFFVIALLVLGKRAKRTTFETLWFSVLVSGFAGLVVSPWLLKNLYWTLNPVYPLLGGFFGTADPTPGIRGFQPVEGRYLRYGEEWWQYLLTPLKMLVIGEDDNPRLYDGKLSPLLLLFFLLPFRRPIKPWVWFGLLITLSYTYCALFFSGPRIRYLLPLIGVIVPLSMYGLYAATTRFGSQYRKDIYGIVLLVQVAFSSLYIADIYSSQGYLEYLSGSTQRETYLTERVAEYGLAKRVKELNPEGKLVYLLQTGNRFYYYDTPVISGGHYSASTLLKWLDRSRDATQFRKEFEIRNIGFVVAHIERTTTSFQAILEPRVREIWNRFSTEDLTLVEQWGPFAIFALSTGEKDELGQTPGEEELGGDE